MRRATCIVGIVAVVLLKISIHALHEESDRGHQGEERFHPISIHALHEESDGAGRAHLDQRHDFNPRSP